MIKDQEFLSKKASYCIDLAKKMGATDSNVVVSNSISETVNFRKELFHKLNVFEVNVEPLSQRVSDIPILIK